MGQDNILPCGSEGPDNPEPREARSLLLRVRGFLRADPESGDRKKRRCLKRWF